MCLHDTQCQHISAHVTHVAAEEDAVVEQPLQPLVATSEVGFSSPESAIP